MAKACNKLEMLWVGIGFDFGRSRLVGEVGVKLESFCTPLVLQLEEVVGNIGEVEDKMVFALELQILVLCTIYNIKYYVKQSL